MQGSPQPTGDGPPAPRLLVLDCAYSLEEMKDRRLEHVVTQLDLDSLFERVWQVHPLLGAGRSDQVTPGPARATRLTPRHTVIEAPVGRVRWLRRFELTNFLLSQCLLFGRLSRLVRNGRVGVVAVADPFYLGLLGLALARVNRIPLVVKVNANYDALHESAGTLAYPRLLRWRWLELLIGRIVLSHADLVTVGSDDNRDYVTRSGARRVATVPTGDMIASVHLTPPRERELVHGELDLLGRPFIVCVGRLEPSKHPDAPLLALAKLKGAVPEAALVLIGDGSMRAQLEEQARSLGLSADVRFTGIRDQVWIARALSSADVVVCPYSGLALVEAALSSTPVVGYDVEWHAEFISSGETGILVPYLDVEALTQAIEALLRDPERGRAIGEAARARALRIMDRHEAVAVKRSVYAELLRSTD